MAPTSHRQTGFVARNRRVSRRFERRLPHTTPDLHDLYARTVARHIDAQPGQTVVDLGAGRSSRFAPLYDHTNGTTVIGVDVSAAELRANTDVDVPVVIEPGGPLPFADGAVDLLVSRSTLEHVAGVDRMLAEVQRVLAPGAVTIHVFPSKLAPFSLLNRLLPRRVTTWLLHRLVPGSDGRLGFPAHYEHCTATAMERALRRHGLEVVRTRVSYYQSRYFAFLVPLYVASVAYELLVRRLGRRDLAATVLIEAVKPADGGSVTV